MPLALSGQFSFVEKRESGSFERGMDLFNKEKYVSAQKQFDNFLKENEGEESIKCSEARYYGAISAMKLFHPDAESRMLDFLHNNKENQKANSAMFELGNYFYQAKNYRKAIEYYEALNRFQLTPDDLAAYFFRTGYSHLQRGDKDRALMMFAEIKDIDTYYTSPATYYFAHIAYEKEMYETAYEEFLKLTDDESFGGVVPFYITQILYMRKDYDGILKMAPELLGSAGPDREIELYRFIGDAYFNKKDYPNAIEYLEKYAAKARASGSEDRYQLAYSYYVTGNYEKAAVLFRELGSLNDIIGQNSWYLLGDCFLRAGDKKNARYAFSLASRMEFDKAIAEDALFNYAKISYETSASPFGEVIDIFNQYITRYPGSARLEEAYDYLVSTYMLIRNYKAALASLDKISKKDQRLEEAYQRVAFYRGLELFRDQEYELSADMLSKSLKYGAYSMEIKAKSHYWRGEALYRLENYSQAMDDYEIFLSLPVSQRLDENQLINYNIGYTYFQQKNYESALKYFLAFEKGSFRAAPDIMTDARNRIADCYYTATRYPEAVEYYNKVIDYARADADYATFQKGFALGLANNQSGKVDALSNLITRFPNSGYISSAYYERGRAHVALSNFPAGETDFNTVIKNYSSSQFVPSALVQLGLLYYNQGDNPASISYFKRVITEYGQTAEARNALTGLKNAYVDMNDVDSYFTFLRSQQGMGDVNTSERDSLLYVSAEKLYAAGNCGRAMPLFASYLEEFQRGMFAVNARFYLAECQYRSGDKLEARKNYLEVVAIPNNPFRQAALATLADLLMDAEEFEQARNYYAESEKAGGNRNQMITAYRGQLNASIELGDPLGTIAAAEKILALPEIAPDLMRESLFNAAKAYYSQNNMDKAFEYFRRVASDPTVAAGAESKYMVAEIQLKRDMIRESEATINEFIEMNTPHQYWMAKGFILLSDISVKKGDMLQAKATLQSLYDFYDNRSDGIIDEVNKKLRLLEGR